MRVCETVRLDPGKRQLAELRLLGDRVSCLWNAANYLCRQAFLAKAGVPVGAELERRMKESPDYRRLPSDVAQESLKKLSEAWKSYFQLRKKWTKDSVTNQKPGLPAYRKDKRTKQRPFGFVPVKCTRGYSVSHASASLVLPSDRRARFKGTNGRLHVLYRGRRRYQGKMGRCEVLYDEVRRRWHMSWTVEVDDMKKPGELTAAVDLGLRITASLSIEKIAQALHFEGRNLLKDWDWFGNAIALEQSWLNGTRGEASETRAPSSRNVSLLHRKRRDRLVSALRAMAKAMAERCRDTGVGTVFLGHPKGILRDVSYGSAKWAGRIHNFWSFDLALGILECAFRKVGIVSVRVGERGSSSHCPTCSSADVVRHPRWRLRCRACGESIHSDQAGSRNILFANNPGVRRDGLQASPRTETLRWNHCRWDPRSADPGRDGASLPEFLRAA
jgi:transposase